MGVSTETVARSLDAIALSRAHSHHVDGGDPLAERSTQRAMWLTLATMPVEIASAW